MVVLPFFSQHQARMKFPQDGSLNVQICLAPAKRHGTSAPGHLQSSRTVPADGSLSPDSFRARRMLLTAELGHRTNPLPREQAARVLAVSREDGNHVD